MPTINRRGLLRCSACSVLLGSGALAEQDGPRSARIALVIGNGAYHSVSALPNPTRDARAISEALSRLGFQVEMLLDSGPGRIRQALRWLAGAAQGSDAALLYYAGHAVEVGGRNLLLPVTVTGRGGVGGLEREAIAFEEVAAALEGRARTALIFLDACRDNPFSAPRAAVANVPRSARSSVEPDTSAGTRSLGGGLASVASTSGTLIAFATSPGRVAMDGQSEHSPFTAALLRHIDQPGLEVREMLARVRRDVREATAGRQVPWDNSSLEIAFYFRPSPAGWRLTARTLEAAAAQNIHFAWRRHALGTAPAHNISRSLRWLLGKRRCTVERDWQAGDASCPLR